MGIQEMMGSIQGLGFINSWDLSKVASGVGNIILIIIVAVVCGSILATILYFSKKKNLDNQKIHFFEEVNGDFIPIEDCMARELVIPNTSIKVFYIPSKDMYLPRGTKKMGKSAYWYAVRNNREITNFTMKNMNRELAEAGLNYDHTDTRYAHLNLREMIKRNYKDKSVKWWKEYEQLISIVVYIFIFTLAFYFLISQIGGLIDQLGGMVDKLTPVLDRIAVIEQQSGSGIR